MKIVNFLQINDYIATSGQPTVDDFSDIEKLGYLTMINLALPTSINAISNEGEIVTSLGMNYVHIPVVWESPAEQQFRLFATLMDYYSSTKVWVHCALNMRVSSFMYLYRLLYKNENKEIAQQALVKIWSPNPVWSEFIAKLEA